AIGRVHARCTWGAEFGDSPFFEGEVEPCINGRVLAIGAYFGPASAPPSHPTICVLEGLLEYERAKGPTPAVTAARERGQEYLLERRLFRSRSTGQVINPAWRQLSFTTRGHDD